MMLQAAIVHQTCWPTGLRVPTLPRRTACHCVSGRSEQTGFTQEYAATAMSRLRDATPGPARLADERALEAAIETLAVSDSLVDPDDGTASEQRAQLAALEQERDAALQTARRSLAKRDRLVEKLRDLSEAALRCMRTGDETAARQLLQDKAAVQQAHAKAQQRADANLELVAALQRVIGRLAKQRT